MAEQRLRILFSEGSSTSARQAITALGLNEHHIEICDPDRHCIGRFSRFVRRFHRCPGLGVDPEAYLKFMLELVTKERFDVLLPIHEQGFALARFKHLFTPHAKLALPSFEAYDRVHSKAGFSQLLSELGLPQPATHFVATAAQARAAPLPAVLKMSIGTASRGVWIVKDRDALMRAVDELEALDAFDDAVLLQELAPGTIEKAQAVFSDGGLVAMHAYRQLIAGAGGGEALKESVARPQVRAHVAQIGAHLKWHGALSVDYMHGLDGRPLYLDCNPRLVEPMNARAAGLDLADILVRVSCGEAVADQPQGRAGVRTHSAIQALLGCAIRSGSRGDLARECWRLLTNTGTYAASSEELTPARLDWQSAGPAIGVAVWLLANPRAAQAMVKGGWGSHLLTRESARKIKSLGKLEAGH
jgi:predicted ATP-grasp superfamily ATP-dependent carboligase